MNFSQTLNAYIKAVGCTSKELSQVSGISVSQISKYKNGKRTPRENSEQVKALARGLYLLAEKKEVKIEHEEIIDSFSNASRKKNDSLDIFSENFRFLIKQLKINMSDLSSFMNYDPSFLSKIKNSSRYPSNINSFCTEMGRFIAKRFNNPDGRMALISVFGGTEDKYREESEIIECVQSFLTTKQTPSNELIGTFLSSLNKTVVAQSKRATPVRLPSIPKTLGRTKYYFGLRGMQSAEADFFRTTILSSSKKSVFIHSDMGMNEVDGEQKQKLTEAVEMLISKGISLIMIHNINRPINEMLMGLEVWIPLYMTGMVSSFYFDELLSSDFPQILCTSGVAALQGECISTNQEASTFLVTTNKNQLEYYFKKRDYMLSRAMPLIKFYSSENEEEFNSFIKNSVSDSKVHEIRKKEFPNISFTVNSGKWISINRIVSDPIHFVVFNKRLIKAIDVFLKNQ